MIIVHALEDGLLGVLVAGAGNRLTRRGSSGVGADFSVQPAFEGIGGRQGVAACGDRLDENLGSDASAIQFPIEGSRNMTELLKKAFAEASKLAGVEQDAMAQWLVERLASQRRCDATRGSPPGVLALLRDGGLREQCERWPLAVVSAQSSNRARPNVFASRLRSYPHARSDRHGRLISGLDRIQTIQACG